MTMVILSICLLLLIIFSAFFSGSETAVMTVNRYKLRTLANKGNKKANHLHRLLQRTDQLLATILLGNTLTHILASSLATMIVIHYFGPLGILPSTIILTIVILIFAELLPKTIAAVKPEAFSFKVVTSLSILVFICRPFVFGMTIISNWFIRLSGIDPHKSKNDVLSAEELRTVVDGPLLKLSAKNREMLLGVLDLPKVTVTDIMITKTDVIGIDINDSTEDIVRLVNNTPYSRLPVFKDDLEEIIGIIHIRNLVKDLTHNNFDKNKLKDYILSKTDEAYFVPESSTLLNQLFEFQKLNERIALIVDEYGDIQGLCTLDDILEEVVGEFTADITPNIKDVVFEKDGWLVIDGGLAIRVLNRLMSWSLPINGAKTISGLVIEELEMIPPPGTCIKISGYPLEVMHVKDNYIKTLRIHQNNITIKSNKT